MSPLKQMLHVKQVPQALLVFIQDHIATVELSTLDGERQHVEITRHSFMRVCKYKYKSYYIEHNFKYISVVNIIWVVAADFDMLTSIYCDILCADQSFSEN